MWNSWFGRRNVLKTKRIAVTQDNKKISRNGKHLNEDSDENDSEREQSAVFYAQLGETGPLQNVANQPNQQQNYTSLQPKKVKVLSKLSTNDSYQIKEVEGKQQTNNQLGKLPSSSSHKSSKSLNTKDFLNHFLIFGKRNSRQNFENVKKSIQDDLDDDDVQEEFDDDEIDREAEEMLKYMHSQQQISNGSAAVPPMKPSWLSQDESDDENTTVNESTRRRNKPSRNEHSSSRVETNNGLGQSPPSLNIFANFFNWSSTSMNSSSSSISEGNSSSNNSKNSDIPERPTVTTSSAQCDKNSASQPYNPFNRENGGRRRSRISLGRTIPVTGKRSISNQTGGKDRRLFNKGVTDENTFWELYKESERNKIEASGLHKLQSFFEIIQYFYNWHRRQAVQSSLLTWLLEDKDFWMFFLHRVKHIAIILFLFNLLSMVFLWFMFSVFIVRETVNDGASSMLEYSTQIRFTLMVYMLPWFFINLMLFLFFALFTLQYERQWPVVLNMKIDMQQYWLMTARLVCAIRLIVLFYTIFSTLISNNIQYLSGDDGIGSGYDHQVCYGIYVLPTHYRSFFYVTAIAIYDIYQISIVSFFPWPWPWIFRLCGIECSAMLLRFQSCSYLIGDFPNLQAILTGVHFVIIMFYLFNISLANLVFERSMRTAYMNIQNQNRAAEEKMKVVNMMCQEIKLPAQQLLQTLTALDQSRHLMTLMSSNLSMESFIQSAKKISFTLNALVDDLLFLTKVEESRFTMHVNDRIHLYELMNDTVLLMMKSIELPSVSIERLCFINTTSILHDHYMYCEKDCLRVLLYHSILCLLAMVSDDKLEDLVTVFDRLVTSGRRMIPLLSIYVQPLRSRRSIGGHVMHVVITINQPNVKLNSQFFGQHGGLFESVCLICHKVARASRTNWNIWEDRVEFVMDCRYVDPNQHLNAGSGSLVHPPDLNPSSASGEGKITTVSSGADIPAATAPAAAIHVGVNSLSTSTSAKSIIDSISHINTKIGNGPGRATNALSPTASGIPVAGTKGSLVKQNSRSMTPTNRSSVMTPTNRNLVQGHGPTRMQRSDSMIATSIRIAHHVDDDIVVDKYTIQSMISTKAFVYLTDRTFDLIMSDILHRLRTKSSDVPMFREVTVADMKIYSIAFVQSVVACREIRNKKFNGIIIMFSERLTYFDAHERSWFDFGVPLPCGEEELDKLMRYLMSVATYNVVHEEVGEQSDPDNLPVAMPFLPTAKGPSNFSSVEQKNKNRFFEEKIDKPRFSILRYLTVQLAGFSSNFSTRNRRLFFKAGKSSMSWWMNPIPRERRESYAKWRFLTPLGRIVHHTLYLELLGISSMLVLLMQYLLDIQSFVFFFSAFIIYLLYYIRRIVYFGILKHYHIRYTAWWYFCCIISFLGVLSTVISEFYVFRNFPTKPAIEDTRENQQSFTEFLQSKHGSIRGMQSLFFLINVPVYMRYYTEFYPWPYGFVMSSVIAIRAIGLVSIYFRLYFSATQIGFIILVIIFYTLDTFFYQYLVEVSHFASFTTLYDLLLAKDFLDRIMMIGRINMTIPLSKLQDLQSSLVEVLKTQAMQDRLLITRSLQSQMSILRLNHVISQELLFQLTFGGENTRATGGQIVGGVGANYNKTSAYYSFENKPKQYFISLMKAKLIKCAVRTICSNFLSLTGANGSGSSSSSTTVMATINDIYVSIHLKLDPSLTLVRVDEELLSAMLSFVCRLAIQRIEKNFASSGSGATGGSGKSFLLNRMDEILIWIRPFDDKHVKGNLKFTDLRMMLITVFDTATLPHGHYSTRDGSIDPWTTMEIRNPNSSNSNTPNNQIPLLFTTKDTGYLTPTSYALCDRYMRLFGSEIRYKAGPVLTEKIAPRYQNYQEIGLPYLLCPDSQKLQICAEVVNKQQLLTIEQNTEEIYNKYAKGYAGILQELNIAESYSAKKLSETIQAIKELSKQHGLLRRKFPGNAYIFTANSATVTAESGLSVNVSVSHRNAAGIDYLGRYVRSSELFEHCGWTCKAVSPTNLYDMLSPQYLDSDCILLDVDFSVDFRCGPNTVSSMFVSSSSLLNHPQFHSHLQQQQHLDTRDLIHVLRDNNYKGLIVVLHPNPSRFNKSTGSMANMVSATAASYAQKKQRLEENNPYLDATRADMQITLPLSPQSVQAIAIAAEKNILSLL